MQMQDTVPIGMWLLLLVVVTTLISCHANGVPCAELSRELRYPCRCELDPHEVDRPVILMDCDRVVFSGELPALPYGAPIVSFRQRWAGHQALPPQLFGDTALPLRAIDFSGNTLRRLTERMLYAQRDSLLELRLADNLLGDTLNPIFASSEFHGLVHLQHLDLGGNRIRAIEEGLLKGCDNLQELRLDRNSLTAVPSASLNGPRSLRILSLAKNRIGTIKSGAFKAQQAMEQLDISDNLISNIEGDAFQAMDRLRVLKLSRNKLTRFNSDVFNGAHNIQHLKLADNFITEFPTVALKVFTGLRYLNLSANVIHNVNNNDLEALVHLYQLDLSRNNIANIAPGTFLGLKQLRLLDISVNSLRTIEDDAFEGLDNLETLSLKDNNILLIPASALGRLPQLGALRLDYNRIAALSGEILRSMAERVSSLVLARNVVRELPPATFQHFRQLQHLDLTGNLLTTLAADTFSGLEGTLRTLRASQNKITALTGAPLALAALQLLDLSDNRLMELPRDTFALLPSLVHLNLSGNPLTTASALPSGLLHRMPLLETLDASRAGLRALPADLLAEASNMRAVYMSGNVILELGDGTFVNMRNLTVVDLSHNGMTSIKPRAFVNTMGIRVLKLNGNQLSSFKGEMFNTGTGLESIDLSDNELGYLFPSAFRIHPRLKSVSVARNKLTFFPAELIAGLQYLEHVDLSGNALKTVDELDFARLPRLRVLNLANNQIDSVSEMSFHNSTQLQLLDLANNMIDRLGERTFEGLVRLQLLNLEGNQLAELPDTIFERARLQMLENVNLARNQFEIAPLKALQRQYFFVSSVNLSRNKVKDIPADDSVMVNIKTLDLSFNPLSSESIANVLGEPKTVRELHLAGCNVTHVTRLETPFLRYLNISHNNITTLSDTVFERTSLLEMLDLSHNQLDTMATAWPMLSSLQTLNVSYNPIGSISQTDLTGLDSLRHLSMHDLHECTRIERNAFRAVPNLAALDAYGYPKLGYLDVQGLLQHVASSLECLNIETKEPALSADQLKPALQPRLRELGVMGSRLKTISSGTLSGVKAASIVIRLRNTSLTHLPAALFFPVPRSSAVTLDLAGSTLATLTAQTLAALDDRKAGLQLLGLDSNPIVCDCSARALWRWLPQHADVTVKCNSPERYTGKLLLALEEHQLTCLNAMHEHQHESSPATTEQLATEAVQPATRSTTEAEIIWSVMAATDRARPKTHTATVGTGNDDTLIIGIVGGVVAFIAILIIVICVIRLRTGGSDHVAGHAHYPGQHLGPPAMLTGGGGPGSSCACSTKGGGAGGCVAPAMYGGYAATTLPHKMTTASAAGAVASRHAYSTMGRVPPYYQNAPQPYFVAAYPTADDKIYR